jgi:hypothetical protein
MVTKQPTRRARARAVVARDVTFARLRAALGEPVDGAAVKELLACAGPIFAPEKARGQLLVAREAGFDLLASPRDGKRGAPLLVASFCLYREGMATPGCPARSRADYVHQQFADLPFGLAFAARRELLAQLPAPRETWLWGTGAVAVDAPLISYDDWSLEGLHVQVHYTEGVRQPAPSADARVERIDVSSADTV